MKPWFSISLGGLDVTGGIQSRLVSLTLTDQAGQENDKLDIELDDRPPHISVPKQGQTLSVSLGYEGGPGESRYVGVKQFLGTFVVDEVRFSKPPSRIKISAHANDTGNKLKENVDKDWHEKTIGDIVKEIAGRHGLTPKVSQALASIQIPHIDQSNTSDQEFLTDLADKNGALFKVSEGNMIFAKKGEVRAMGGQSMPVITIPESECTQYDALLQNRSEYDGAVARYWDLDKAEEKEEFGGKQGKNKNVSKRFPDKEQSKRAAEGKNEDLAKEKETISLTCVGNPLIVAESIVILTGFRPGIRTTWRAQRVTHKMDSGGYTTDVECELPDAAAKDEQVSGRD